MLIEVGLLDAKDAEELTSDILAEYRADYSQGTEIVGQTIRAYSELDKRSTAGEKSRRLRDVLRKVKEQVLENKSCITESEALTCMAKSDPKLQTEVDQFIESCTNP